MDSLSTISRMNMGGPIGFVSPIPALASPFGGQVGQLDQVSLGNEVSDTDFFAQMARLKQSALAARNGSFGAGPQGVPQSPYEMPMTGSNEDFIQQMRALRQQALAQRAQQGGQDQGKDDGKGGKTATEGGRFSITARALERDGKTVPVSSISIHEVGNWGGNARGKARDVEHYYDSWDSSQREKTNTFDRATTPGAYYQVTVTWADGTTKTVDRQMPTSGDFNETIYQSW